MAKVIGAGKGVCTIVLFTINAMLVCIPLLIVCPIKLISPQSLRRFWERKLDHWVIDGWVGTNRLLIRWLSLANVSVTWYDADDLSREQWYMVISNHQSWTDILVLQTTLFDRIPPVKFFTKRQLIWIPFVGIAMWLLGFPYVRRLDRTQVTRAANKGTKSDRQATLEACERFRSHPTAVLNFLEGTRFTPAKHARQAGRYRHLLNPKVGGLSYVMGGLSSHLHKLLDITIVYPDGTPTFWEFLQGNCTAVNVRIDCYDIPADLREVTDDSEQRKLLAPWVRDLWQAKDERIHNGKAD
tara:strand:- start:5710 stop:6603 length:894 start_codon:yes stop_codon:yes gene_type:complete